MIAFERNLEAKQVDKGVIEINDTTNGLTLTMDKDLFCLIDHLSKTWKESIDFLTESILCFIDAQDNDKCSDVTFEGLHLLRHIMFEFEMMQKIKLVKTVKE